MCLFDPWMLKSWSGVLRLSAARVYKTALTITVHF